MGGGLSWGEPTLPEESQPDPGAWTTYNAHCRTLTRRVFFITAATFSMVLVGLACLPLMLIGWVSQPAPPVHRVVWLWRAPLVFTLFFAAVMLLGAANGVLVWRTGSLFPAIFVHAVYNLLIMMNVYVAYQWPW